MTFKDYFSRRAGLYATYRPRYPESLFQYLAGLTDEHDMALDCGTGNGQAAVELAKHFKRVIATDPSSAQIDNAEARDNIEYRIARADEPVLPAMSAALVTIAQALHWLN